MKWLLVALVVLSLALILGGSFAFAFWDACKPYIDRYANHASVLGFFVSVVGFILTVSAIFETLRVSKEAQREIEANAAEARKETRILLQKIRIRIMEDTCEQAFRAASDARKAIRAGEWLKAAERSQDARQLASRLVGFGELVGTERDVIRKAIEELKDTIGFIERNRLKPTPAQGMPDKTLRPVDSLIDELDKVRSRLQHEFLEATDVDESKN